MTGFFEGFKGCGYVENSKEDWSDRVWEKERKEDGWMLMDDR